MPSRQERRKAERDVVKARPAGDAAARADAANAGPAGDPPAARASDWTTQSGDPNALVEALGAETVGRRAASGDRDAQYSWGFQLLYDYGQVEGGRSPTAGQGVVLLEKAAEQGHAYAMEELGSMYYERDVHELALDWYTKAADAGLPRAKLNVGYMLENAEGVAAPDPRAALKWYTEGAKQVLRHGLVDHAAAVWSGEAPKVDFMAAGDKYRRRANNAHGAAAHNLAGRASFLYLVGRSSPYPHSSAKLVRDDLTKAIAACVCARPEDPVEFVAQYLRATHLNGYIDLFDLPPDVGYTSGGDTSGADTE
jgi:TPR repeat protein